VPSHCPPVAGGIVLPAKNGADQRKHRPAVRGCHHTLSHASECSSRTAAPPHQRRTAPLVPARSAQQPARPAPRIRAVPDTGRWPRPSAAAHCPALETTSPLTMILMVPQAGSTSTDCPLACVANDRRAPVASMHNGGYSRGRAKTQVAVRDGFHVSLRPRLAQCTRHGRIRASAPRPGRLREDMTPAGKAGLGGPAISSLERTAGIGVCLASGVKFEPASYRRACRSRCLTSRSGRPDDRAGSWGQRRSGAAAVVTGHADMPACCHHRRAGRRALAGPGVYQTGPSGASVQVNGEGGAR
jgi:hypothetical protein